MQDVGGKSVSDNAEYFSLVFFSCPSQSVLNVTSSGTKKILKLTCLGKKSLIANYLDYPIK